MHTHTPQDGDTIKLSSGENAITAEFVNTNGRLAWRLYDRHGKGIMLTEDEMRLLGALIANALAIKDNQ